MIEISLVDLRQLYDHGLLLNAC